MKNIFIHESANTVISEWSFSAISTASTPHYESQNLSLCPYDTKIQHGSHTVSELVMKMKTIHHMPYYLVVRNGAVEFSA